MKNIILRDFKPSHSSQQTPCWKKIYLYHILDIKFHFVNLIELEFMMMSVGKELFRNEQNIETFLLFENSCGIHSIRAHLNCGDGWCAWFVGRYKVFLVYSLRIRVT